MLNYLPVEIKTYIKSFLKKCVSCSNYYTSNILKQCVFCNRTWCNICCNKHTYIRFVYFEIYLLTCNSCYHEFKSPQEEIRRRTF